MNDIIVIGGGLAGLTASLKLSKSGFKVLLIEKKNYPFHRVCGEYISNEVLPYFETLGIFPHHLGASSISEVVVSSGSGKVIHSGLPLGGFGISRYMLDNKIAELARSCGVTILENTQVDDAVKIGNNFLITTDKGGKYECRMVIGSFGKRSTLDRKLNRPFFYKRSPYMGVKYHIEYNDPDNLISLHNFQGGYCGINKIEGNKYSLCYLLENSFLKKYENIKAMEKDLLSKNPFLKDIFDNAKFLYAKPEVINEVSFDIKSIVENGICMAGDSVGMISPLCGNGMAIAIHTAKALSEIIIENFSGNNVATEKIEKQYSLYWKKKFNNRIIFGKQVQNFCGKEVVTELAIGMLSLSKPTFRWIIGHTHGKPFS